jgi:hypothetical protein
MCRLNVSKAQQGGIAPRQSGALCRLDQSDEDCNTKAIVYACSAAAVDLCQSPKAGDQMTSV